MQKKRLVLELPENHFVWQLPRGSRRDFVLEALNIYNQNTNNAALTVKFSELIAVLKEIREELTEIRRHLNQDYEKTPVESIQTEQKPSVAEHLRKMIKEIWDTDEEGTS